MPIVEQSEYNSPSIIHRNRHVSTIYAALFKKFDVPGYTREKLELKDGDFINIDFIINDPKKAVILCHGLEGDSRRTYNNSCADYFHHKGFSVFAWNNRTCGGEMNRLQDSITMVQLMILMRLFSLFCEKDLKMFI